MTCSTRAASSTVRQIGPTRVLMPAWIMPSRLTSSCVGEMPTALAARAGLRIEAPVSSAIAHVTRFARDGRARAGARAQGAALGVVRIAERAAERAARNARCVLAEVGFGQDDRAGGSQPRDERGVVGRAIVGVASVGARRAAHVVRVVLILDREHDAVQRPDELARGRELGVEVGRDLERIGHRRVFVGGVRHAARLALVEAPFRASRRAQIQRLQRVDLAGVRDRLDRARGSPRAPRRRCRCRP